MTRRDDRSVHRILMTGDAVGGVWTYALELTRALAAYDVDVILAVMGPPPSAPQRREAAALANLHLVCGHFRLEWMDEAWSDVQRAGAWLRELEARWAPDVVHLNGFVHGALAWRAPVIVVGHSCVRSWWAAVLGEAAPPAWHRYRDEVATGLAAADIVVAPSASMLQALALHYGLPLGDRARVISNGRRAEAFSIRAKEPIVMTAGRLWDRAKNVAALGEVAPRLPWPVYAAGADGAPARTDRAGDHAGALRRLGPLSSAQLARWLGRASIYALPARYEPFGLSALEAALAGCALVLGDIPSLREVWGEAATFVAPDDPSALEAAIVRLIAAEDLREQMAAAARARALEYSPARMAASYMEAYEHLSLLSLAGL